MKETSIEPEQVPLEVTSPKPYADQNGSEINTGSEVGKLRSFLVRSNTDRVVTGLSGGIASRLGISPSYVRAGFLAGVFAGGVGLLLYAIGWALSIDEDDVDLPQPEPASANRKIALALVYLGAVLALRSMGIWFSDQLFFPIALVAFGAAAVWDRTGGENKQRISKFAGSPTAEPPNRTRIVVGAVLMTAGIATLFSTFDAFSDAGPALLAVALTAGGFMLVFGSWVWKLAGDLAAERRERIRSEERSEMAAHLHDSVLQTLALIQRSDDARHMVTLARAQERELREWLYGRRQHDGPDDIEAAIGATASRVESDHDVPIEVVVVGQATLTNDLRALVQAAGEAMTNAAQHSGTARVAVFVEVGEDVVEVFVADQGGGFEPDEIAPERRGIADSIIGRMKRHGGTAEITSNEEEGTEVHLTMPVTTP